MSKKRNNENEETKYEAFIRNYSSNPAFKALIKLSGYFIFFLVFIIIVSLGGKDNNNSNSNNTLPNEVTKPSITYKEMLNNLSNNDIEIDLSVKIDELETKISGKVENNIITGIIESNKGIKKFKITDDSIYEISMNNENINNELFGNINYIFLNPKKMVEILESNQATKRIKEGYIYYNYSIINNEITYNVTVTVKDEKIISIELKDENHEYIINYK